MGSLRFCWQSASVLAFSAILAGCSSLSTPTSRPVEQSAPIARSSSSLPVSGSNSRSDSNPSAVPKGIPALPAAGSGRGGYYLDDGPGDKIPEGLLDVTDAEPKVEPYARASNRPYVAFGQSYVPITDNRPYKQQGYGSWYGKRFHGKRTSSGELYDMYKMTAAHPTLPIPSYARVTNLNNGKQVIVRINDRGPFRSSRIIDLSYTAALKLGYLGKGSGLLEVEHLLPNEIERMARNKRQSPASTVAAKQDTTPEQVLKSGGVQEGKAQDAKSSDFLDQFLESGKTPASPKLVGTAGGYYLQLGVYKQPANARSMQAKYEPAWRSEGSKIEVVNSGEHYKLLMGPFPTREKAMSVAQRFRESEGLNAMIVQR